MGAYPETVADRHPHKLRPEDLPPAGGARRPASARAPYGEDAGSRGFGIGRQDAQQQVC